MSWPDVCQKFNRLADPLADAEKRAAMIQMVENLETLNDVNELTGLLRKT
jgi:hypothetical protein